MHRNCYTFDSASQNAYKLLLVGRIISPQMVLNRGAKFGSYEIQSPLGAGGLGEVYLATQSSLNRRVAIKVLASSSASDPERLRGRFTAAIVERRYA